MNPQIIDALRKAARRGVKVEIVCGPNLSHKEEVMKLAEEGVIDLYFSPNPQEKHFIVSTNGQLYWEKPHCPGEPSVGYNFPENYFEAKPHLKKFEQIKKDSAKYEAQTSLEI